MDWYAPHDITFSREQMVWLIENREMLHEGKWPPQHIETGRTDKQIGHSAPFEVPIIHIVEVTDRLKQVGDIRNEFNSRLTAAKTDGKLLLAEVDAGKTISELSYESRTILNYISGWKRKKMSLTTWRKQYRFRHKMTTKSNQIVVKLDKPCIMV